MSDAEQNRRTFQAILEEKLNGLDHEETFSTDSVINAPFPLEFPYENFEFTLETPLVRKVSPPVSSAYLKKNNKITKVKPSQKREANDPIFSIASLSTAAQLAISELEVQTEPDRKHIRASSVKRAFRKKARECHPDLNPNQCGEEFSDYRNLSQTILSELKKAA